MIVRKITADCVKWPEPLRSTQMLLLAPTTPTHERNASTFLTVAVHKSSATY